MMSGLEVTDQVWTDQVCEPDDVCLRYISTSLMTADIFTKAFS